MPGACSRCECPLPAICRAAELVRLVGHAAGGRPAERLLRRLGMPQGDDRILRHLKRHAAAVPHGPIRVAGIDDWSWRRGTRYGTVVVDMVDAIQRAVTIL
jgi:hypothetical protein